MRGIRAAGAGLGVLVAAAAGPAGEPAARLGAARSVEARGQAPGLPPGGTPPAPGQAGVLGQPRPLPQGPTVTEQRGNSSAPPAAAGPPPVVFGPAVPYGPPAYGPAVPFAGTPPSVQPYGAPAAGFAPDMEPPLFGPGGTGPAAGPLGLLTGGGGGFGGRQRLRLDADFLLWFVKSGSAPPLVTTSTPASNGILGNPDTRVLYGGDTLGRTLHNGGRFAAVYGLDDAGRWGVDGSLFFLARRGLNETFSTATDPLLARPFTNLNQGIQFSEVVAAPGLAGGAVAVTGDTSMWGADINVRRHLGGNCTSRLDGFAGFRYLNFSETLQVTESFVRQPGAPETVGIPNALAGTITDRFRTENHFYGPQLGLTGEVRNGRWFAEGRVAVAMGPVFQRVEINGGQLVNFPTGPVAFAGGLLAIQGANIGSYHQRKFGVLPEVGVKLGYHVTDRLRLNVGYNFLYLNSVLRPGDQIDTGLDVTRIPNFPLPGNVQPLPQVRPAVLFREVGVFAQGISFGLSWAF